MNIISFLDTASKKEYKSWKIIQILTENHCRIQEDNVKNDLRIIKLVDSNNNVLMLKSTRIFDNNNIQLISTIERIDILYHYYNGNKKEYSFNGIY